MAMTPLRLSNVNDNILKILVKTILEEVLTLSLFEMKPMAKEPNSSQTM